MAKQMRLIKKYPNRRLYDTQTSSYITLADVRELVMKQEEFQVVDAKTGEDLSRSILLQIILEEENAGGHPMFSLDMLTQFIRTYGSAMQGLMGDYLEKNIQAFLEIQKNIQDQTKGLFGDNTKAQQDLWSQFMTAQAPAMQGMMAAYMEQSKKAFEQIQNQSRVFGNFSFPGFPASGEKPGGGS
jgi:polyhydroxyalkanoate synthesis repressor PhaR